MFGTHDPLFDAPFVDVDEWRDEPVRHRYVHGGFEGTDARFSLYFPPSERYEGRFFHPVMPVSGTEHAVGLGLLAGMGASIEFAVDSGAYLVESNQGRSSPFPGDDPTIAGYRASAATARYSRVLAAEMYGEHRPYGYIYGGSGGAFKTMSCFETCPDVWDGAVPFIHGTQMSMPNQFTVLNHALRILRDKFPQITDAVEPGGSGDIYAGLTTEEREALVEVTRFGFPPRSWFDVERIAASYSMVWSLLVDNVIRWDPEYFDDFWTVPGYLGYDPPPSLARVRLQHPTVVTETVNADQARERGLPLPLTMNVGSWSDAPVALRVDSIPDASLQGAAVRMTSGKANEGVLYITNRVDDYLAVGFGEEHAERLSGVAVGDEVVIDNSVYLASQTYHRHQFTPAYLPWHQFQVAGRPIYPQRPFLLGPRYARQGAGSIQSGRFAGKMIIVNCLMDEAAYACGSVEYRKLVEDALGDRIDDQYRLWLVDHTLHTAPVVMPGAPRPVATTRVVGYAGALQQALRDVSAWAELGIAPPPSTEFQIHDCQICVGGTAAERRGIQPVATVTANGRERADVAVGEPVRFEAVVGVPPGAGTVVAAEWDFDGAGDYPYVEPTFDGSETRAAFGITHAFEEPGTYFPALRVTSHRQGDVDSPFARVQNLGRVRVVVSS
jgi:hypothetical protein